MAQKNKNNETNKKTFNILTNRTHDAYELYIYIYIKI